MQTKNLMVGCALGALMAGTAAWAGYKESTPVTIDTSSRLAYGSYGSARASADSTQYITCYAVAYTSTSSFIVCEARDANGNSATCVSNAPAMVAVAASQSSSSLIQFSWDANGDCTYLSIVNSSLVDPLQP